MSKIFPNNNVTCAAPWYQFRVWSTGKVAPCDAFQKQFHADRFDDWYRTGAEPVNDRQQMQQGNSPEGCKRCQESQSKNIISFRNRANFRFAIQEGDWFYESLKQSPSWSRMQSPEISPNHKPSLISITFSNECESSCRMCIPKYSNTIADLWKELKIDQYASDSDKFDFSSPSVNQWYNDEEKYKSLTNLVFDNPGLIYLKINGGEPFAQPIVRKFLQECVDNNATNFDLYITTNGTIYDESFIKLIKKFKAVMIDLSIEGFHPTNDYIRIGTSYKQVQENILKFKEHHSPTFEVKVHTLPQLLSVEHYNTAVDFCLENNVALYGNPIFNPRHYMMEVLPIHHKQRIKKKFIDMYKLNDVKKLSVAEQVNFNSKDLNIKNSQGITTTISNQLIKMIHLLDSPEQPEYEQYRKDFVYYTKIYDKHFNMNFLDYYPELEDFYYEYSDDRI
jgi:MoaA/NifB/PqqE/SkfB family radical SAM enzyme